MLKREPKLYIEDIKDSIDKIERYVGGLPYDEFFKNSIVIDAVVRNLEIIGEAAKNIPEEIRSNNPDVAWSEAVGMRNKITHEYFGVDEEVLWQTIKEDLPVFREQILALEKKIK